MKYLFDSSAIFRAIKENKVEILTGNYTLELARYELANIIWKDYALQEKISMDDSKSLLLVIKHTLTLMDVLGIAGHEEAILETAMQLKITFYDASYVCLAKTKELCLITEDSRLTNKVANKISTSNFDSLES